MLQGNNLKVEYKIHQLLEMFQSDWFNMFNEPTHHEEDCKLFSNHQTNIMVQLGFNLFPDMN